MQWLAIDRNLALCSVAAALFGRIHFDLHLLFLSFYPKCMSAPIPK